MSAPHPTLDRMGIPVAYNAAGIAYVRWDDMRDFTRPIGWETEVANKVAERPKLEEGTYAWVLEEILTDMEQRTKDHDTARILEIS